MGKAFESMTPECYFVQLKHDKHLEDEYFRNEELKDRIIIASARDSLTISDEDSNTDSYNLVSGNDMSTINPISNRLIGQLKASKLCVRFRSFRFIKIRYNINKNNFIKYILFYFFYSSDLFELYKNK